MPTYEYTCQRCGSCVEIERATPPKQPPACETCEQPTERVYSAPTVQYACAGFYCKESKHAS